MVRTGQRVSARWSPLPMNRPYETLTTRQAVGLLLAYTVLIALWIFSGTGFLPRWVGYACYDVFLIAWGLRYIQLLWPKLRTQGKRASFTALVYVPSFVAAVLLGDFGADGGETTAERFFIRLKIACTVSAILIGIYYFIYKNKPNMRKKIVAGNWKMNTFPAEGVQLAKEVVAGRGEVCSCVNFIVCPPFTHLSEVAAALKGSDVELGAQNCAAEAKGAYTGEVAASMIAALGCKYVILGHSERRQYYGETSETLNKKMEQAYANGLTPIYCVGENLDEREAGKHFEVVKAQIEEVVYNLTAEQFAQLVIAYEPVWAIGTGKTATAEQAQEIHAYIRKVLADKFGAAAAECPILYGGSCKPSNAAELFAKEDVDGGLIGGAALKAEDFLAIGKGFSK